MTSTDRELVSAARELWDGARHREEWYAALALLRHRYYRAWQDPALLPLLGHLVRTGGWWDVVDEIAAHLVGGVSPVTAPPSPRRSASGPTTSTCGCDAPPC